MQQYLFAFLKGVAMGAANVIPGVSGGTIALITGIFERLINAIKSLNLKAIRLFFSWKIKEFIEHTDFYFLVSVFAGIGISIISLAKLLEYLFQNFQVLVWAYFFGLILASVYYVGKTISKWTWKVIGLFIVGFIAAVLFTLLSPAKENNTVVYNFIAGIVAACSMILPGLSGSFVLLLMGNYQLIMIEAVSNFDFSILIPVGIGAVVGIVAFSYILSWVFKKFKDETISLLTGFILGSLAIIWPWKTVVETYIDRHGATRPLLTENVMPGTYETITQSDSYLIYAIICILCGIISIVVVEYTASKSKS
jgi:putative membrane protein